MGAATKLASVAVLALLAAASAAQADDVSPASVYREYVDAFSRGRLDAAGSTPRSDISPTTRSSSPGRTARPTRRASARRRSASAISPC